MTGSQKDNALAFAGWAARLLRLLLPWFAFLGLSGVLGAQQASDPLSINIDFNGGGEGRGDLAMVIQIVVLMTLLSLAPSIVMLMTCFTRIVIVLGFVRQAVGVNTAPSNQIIIGLALFLTFFIMAPVWDRMNTNAIQPYLNEEIQSEVAFDRASNELRTFMLRQTRESDIDFFLGLSGTGAVSPSDVPMRVAIPAFVLSELRTAFQMGFLLFIPFLIVDFLVASTLMSMGMMMMPPVIVSMPFKLLLFVLVDGWYLVIRSLVESFNF